MKTYVAEEAPAAAMAARMHPAAATKPLRTTAAMVISVGARSSAVLR